MRAYFMRHGRTNYNDLALCNDDPRDVACLTAAGIAQAERAARELRAAPLQRIYVSELPRTQQTAAIVNRGRDLPVVIDARINDIRSGFNNRPVAEYQAAIAHDPLRACVNGGETLLEHKARVLSFLDALIEDHVDGALVVAHEETMRVFAARIRSLSDAEMIRLVFPNCAVFSAELA